MIKGRKVYDPLTDTWSTGYWVVDDKGNYYPAWQKGAVMERLTNREYGEISCTGREIPCSSFCNNCSQGTGNCEIVKRMVEKLADYEDLEEQGRLLKLPCKVGDTVYCIFNRYTKCTFNNEEFDECSCQGCEYECDSKKENYVQDMWAYSLDWIVTNLKNFGKTVFLTREEAETRLKELRGNNE